MTIKTHTSHVCTQVRRRLRDREKRELLQRIEQDSFVSLRRQFG